MNVKEAYNQWAAIYDDNQNKTRDLEGCALFKALEKFEFDQGLELGCGTGKNTAYLSSRVNHLLSVDLSEAMLARAKEKIQSDKVSFQIFDIREPWTFTPGAFDLVTFSLVLEHIEDLDDTFRKAAEVLKPGGKLYVGELHPFKQYLGTRARFDDEEGRHEVTCFTHHISDFIQAAQVNGLDLIDMREYFDDGEQTSVPRILALLFGKK